MDYFQGNQSQLDRNKKRKLEMIVSDSLNNGDELDRMEKNTTELNQTNEQLKSEINSLKKINQDMYTFLASYILNKK